MTALWLYFTAPVSDDFFLVADSIHKAILQVDATNGAVHAIDTRASLDMVNPIAVEYDPLSQYVYFSDVVQKVINRIKLDGSGAQVWLNTGEGMS